jgi:Fe2+ or Zn2+ uptake regulation protein
MQPNLRLHAELRIYRLSRTRQRDEVFRQICRLEPVKRAALAAELAGYVSKMTVYRCIKTFINAQVVRELPGGLIERRPPFRQQHYAILCRSCGRRTRFWDQPLEAKLNSILERRRYVLAGHQLELSGLCSLCAQQV